MAVIGSTLSMAISENVCHQNVTSNFSITTIKSGFHGNLNDTRSKDRPEQMHLN